MAQTDEEKWKLAQSKPAIREVLPSSTSVPVATQGLVPAERIGPAQSPVQPTVLPTNTQLAPGVIQNNNPGIAPIIGPQPLLKPIPNNNTIVNNTTGDYTSPQGLRNKMGELINKPTQSFVDPSRGGITDSGLRIKFDADVPQGIRKTVMQDQGANDPVVLAAYAKQQEQLSSRNAVSFAPRLAKSRAERIANQEAEIRREANAIERDKLATGQPLVAAQTAHYTAEAQKTGSEVDRNTLINSYMTKLQDPKISATDKKTIESDLRAFGVGKNGANLKVLPGKTTKGMNPETRVYEETQGPPIFADPETGTYTEAQPVQPTATPRAVSKDHTDVYNKIMASGDKGKISQAQAVWKQLYGDIPFPK